MRPSFVQVLLGVALGSMLVVGCKAKPSEKACKEAIENVRRIYGQEMSDVGADPTAAIRSCRGNSSKASVECVRTAKTIEDLRACEGEEGEKVFQEAAEQQKKQAEESAAKGDEEAGDSEAAPPAPSAAPAEDTLGDVPAHGIGIPATDAQAGEAAADGKDDETGADPTGAQ